MGGETPDRSFGWHYDFSKALIEEAAPIPDWLMPMQQLAAQFAGLKATDLVQALLIYYPPGATLGWHRDRPVFEHVLGISLGTTVKMRFRRRRDRGFQRHAAVLPPRSLYHLAGEARHLWEHSIPATDVTRWSITFRSLSDRTADRPFPRRQTA
ncbi:alpha-ketoglutarate-dependent dioxygenase AlkB [Dongia soli]|uniref:Alpha-ketoglutarate-dependent dioxygenase AlkB n=1 Tax=Dongia soli TaxID=600628 RepID=A0ABU5EF30_9PROT|nr:alpha-ketoglutarate-dependent dioxygenase AlkB [Dongia soli]MDY0884998.1 alpha-ketoglutarate-dependent dioxygenase AlkB [Dongia soli]